MKTPLKIDQRYEIIKNLGGGLSGEVVLVKDEEGIKALKFLKKIQMNVSREDALRNFKNEFSILKELNHPNISRILDFGFEPRLQKYYFSTEFIEGAELHKACENQPIEIIEKMAVQVLRALNYLHSRGIYHFDIKPQNILVYMKSGVPITAKIIDFGLAGFTSSRKKVGTPAYMAPEVIQGGMLDGRTDLYSFGVLLYKILTGTNPFLSKNLKEILHNQVHLIPKSPSEVNPDLPKYWDHIVERLLEKNPVNRYSQASLVIRDLNFLSNKNFDIETKDTKLSYLPEKGTLIGREDEWEDFAEMFANVFMSDTLPNEKTLIIQGDKGTGKTRLLSEIKYFSQLRNVPIKTIKQLETEEKAESFILMIDDASIEANRVSAFMQELANEKTMIIWATHKSPDNWADTCVLHLKNYNKEQLKQYLESVTGLSSTPDKLIDEVFKRTQGNPLFVTEFIKLLLDSDLLFDSSGKWDATTFEDIKIDFNKIHIPNSMEEILRDQYQKLEHEQQSILNWLAVNKEPLYLENLATLTKQNNVQSKILELIQQDILEKTTREHTYFFKNLLFINVIYKLIPSTEKPAYHDNLADIIKDDNSQHQHYLYHIGNGSHKDQAEKALSELGAWHLDQANYDQSISTYLKLVKIQHNQVTQKTISGYFKLAKAYYQARYVEKAIQTYKKIINTLLQNKSKDNLGHILEAYERLIESHLKLLNYDNALELIQESQPYIKESPTKLLHEVIFKNYKAFVYLKKDNQFEKAKEIYLETRDIWLNQLNDSEKIRVVNNRLNEVYMLTQEKELLIKTCKENINFLKNPNSRFELAQNYYALGDVYRSIIVAENRDNKEELIEKCIENFLKCEEVARSIHDYRTMYSAFNGLGNLYNEDKNYEKALYYYKRALNVVRKTNEPLYAAAISYNIGYIHGQQQQYKDAYAYLIYAINTLEGFKGQFSPYREDYLFLCYMYLSEVHTESKEFEKAHKALGQADAVVEEYDFMAHRAFWKEIRRAHLYISEENKDKALVHLNKAEPLANGEDEKLECDKMKKLYNKTFEQNTEKEKQQTQTSGVKVMTSNNKLTSGEDLKKIIEINRFINSEHDADQLLKIVLNYAIQLSNAESGFVLLLNEEGNLDVRASLNTSAADEEKISMSVAKMAIEKGEIISSSDALSDERFDSSESIVLNELKSVLCLPIRSKYKSVGVFYLDNRFRINAFDDCNVDLLNAFCDQVGIALENSKLISQLMDAKNQLEHRLDKTTAELTEVKNILKTESETYKTKYAYKQIIAKSNKMQEIFKLLDKVTETNLSIFIYGESGTGKELVAKALHYNSPSRNANRFVAINCGAIPANLMESELFGHKAGSFTGAIKDKKGLFEEANGGTILLDEIGELDAQLQVKLLRVLQEGEVQRIGETKTIKVNVRVLCASHKDLATLVKQNKFREDLYYRLCQMKIDLPPLRDRSEDTPLLAKHFVEKYRAQNKIKEEIQIPPLFMKAVLEYDWPGNIRELENLISVACALKEGNTLSLENIPPNFGIKQYAEKISIAHLSANLADMSVSMASMSLKAIIDENNIYDHKKTWQEYEATIIAKCYELNDKKKVQTAEMLGVSHSTIYKKIADLNLDDSSNPVYADPFIYDGKSTLKEYVIKIFKAALDHHNEHPYAAIKQLNISQGYFYKIMKEFKQDVPVEENRV